MERLIPTQVPTLVRSVLAWLLSARFRAIARIESNPEFFLALSAIGLLAYLTLRNLGPYPVVFADEWSYSMGARHLPASQSFYPSHLFHALFRSASDCRERFLDCVRFYNAVFFALSLPFIYLVARQYVDKWVAVVVATFAVFSPISSYSLYFMPESMYFFLFWVLTWFILRFPGTTPIRLGTGAGLILALMFYVKFHALFLLGAVVAYLAIYTIQLRTRVARRAWIAATAALVTMYLVTTLTIQFVLVQGNGATQPPRVYTSLTNSAFTWEQAQRYLPNFPILYLLHLLGLVLLFALPTAILVDGLRRPDVGKKFPNSWQSLRFYLIVLLLLLVAVVSLFNAYSTGSGTYEVEGRLSMRYYSFLFPLFLLLAACEAHNSASPTTEQPHGRRMVALAVGAVVILAYVVLSNSYAQVAVDSPELAGLFRPPSTFLLAAILSLVSLALWGFARQLGARFYLFCLAPVMLLTANHQLNAEVRRHYLRPNIFDSAGMFARQYLERKAADLVVVTSDEAGGYRALFAVDQPNARPLFLPPGTPLELAHLGKDQAWALIIGDYPLRFEPERTISLGNFSLVKLPTESRVVDFRQELKADGITVHGLGARGPKGRWSIGKTVELRFDNPLPNRFAVEIMAHAFGPNVGKRFQVAVGNQSRSAILGETLESISLDFEPTRATGLITITVPTPTSPQELGIGGDQRKLGMVLRELSIRALEDN